MLGQDNGTRRRIFGKAEKPAPAPAAPAAGRLRGPKMAVPRRIMLLPHSKHSSQSPLMPIDKKRKFVSSAFIVS